MKFAKELSIILGISLLGEIFNKLLPLPVPAGVYGLFLMLGLLCTGILHLEDLDNMSMMFIPAGVGIIRYREQLMQVGVPYLVINVLSTFIVFVVTGWAAQWMMERGGKKQ